MSKPVAKRRSRAGKRAVPPPAVPRHGETWDLTLAPDLTMTFVFIHGGRFRMGQRGEHPSEEPVHWVKIPDGFWLAETPVTQAQFAAWKKDHENRFPGLQHPAENVTWYEARDYCEWLCGLAGLAGSRWRACLPDEAHWEYACRAGTETEYWNGDGEAALAEVGWYDGNSDAKTHPVKKKNPNGWGLHDMHGNVWEWCADVWDARAYRKRIDGWEAEVWTEADAGDDAHYWEDEEAGGKSPIRVLRGGSWGLGARHCRSAHRDRLRPSARYGHDGFRVCLARSSPAQVGRQEAEPGPGGEVRRRAEAEPDGPGVAGADEIDLARERLPKTPHPNVGKAKGKRRGL